MPLRASVPPHFIRGNFMAIIISSKLYYCLKARFHTHKQLNNVQGTRIIFDAVEMFYIHTHIYDGTLHP